MVSTNGVNSANDAHAKRQMGIREADVHIRRFTSSEAVEAASWRYAGDLSIYDGRAGGADEFLAVADSGHGYYAIVNDRELVGFCCFGLDARVAGQPAEGDGLLDVGGGIRPDLVGRGLGADGLAAVLAYARHRFSPRGFRMAIASFNRRSIVLSQTAGSHPTATFEGPGGREFTQLVLMD